MGTIGGQEIFVLMLLALIFFGSKKLPEIARGLGKGISEFKKAARDVQLEITKEIDRSSTFDSRREPVPPESPELTGSDSDTTGSGKNENPPKSIIS